MRSTAALLLCLLVSACATPPETPPPVPVIVRVPVPVMVYCETPDPECREPAFNAATKEQPGDAQVKLLRSETVEQADCLRRTRLALAGCRKLP